MRKVLPGAFAAISLLFCTPLHAQTGGPWVNGVFQGRIALSHDGNFNDADDWGAFPLSIALLDALGVMDKVVHIEFNNIIQNNDPRYEKEMTASVLGAAEQYGIPKAVLHNCRTDLVGAIQSITAAVNASSAENPLYYVVVGPMDVPYYGIVAADPAKRRHVYCISHSCWNDGFGNRKIQGLTKRHLIELGIKWIQTMPGHQPGGLGLSKSHQSATPEEWAAVNWIRDAGDERLRWVYTRFQAEDCIDACDTTCTYFLLTGDEQATFPKLAPVLLKKQKPEIIATRPTIRLEAENFESLENLVPVYGGSRYSQRVLLRSTRTPTSAIRTSFHEFYAAQSARYQVGIRCRDLGKGAATFTLLVNGAQQGPSWKAPANDESWKTQTIQGVPLALGDQIAIAVQSDGGQPVELDYVQLDYRGPK